MKLCRCPVCHAHITLEAIVQDEAARAMMSKVAHMADAEAAALVTYLGLFRSEKRDLSFDRALKLANEALALESMQFLAPAMRQTVQAMHDKRATQGAKPLTNHNYLKKVLESVVAEGVTVAPVATDTQPQPAVKMSQSLSGVAALESLKNGGLGNA